MALTADQVVVKLRADVAEYLRNMNKAEASAEDVNRHLASLSKGVGASRLAITGFSRDVSTAVTGAGRAFVSAFSAAVLVGVSQKLIRIADAATQMRNSLRVAGLEGDELSRVYDQLFRSAQRNATPVNSLVDLYSKLALTQKELGVTSEELIHFTDGIAVALRVGGTDAQAASGALLQLSQALGGGVVRAEEFNSILEGTPTIAQAVARGLKEAGGSVAELRKLVNDGKVSSTAWFRAFEAGSEELRRQAETSQVTVGQSFTRLGNSLLTVVGEFDKATDASGKFAQGISDLANGIESFDASGFISEIQRIIDKFLELESAGTSWLNALGNSSIFGGGEQEWFNTVISPETGEAEEKIALLEREITALQAQIENQTRMGFDASEPMARLAELKAELAAVQAMAANLPRYIPGANMMDRGSFISAAGYTPPPAAIAAPEPQSKPVSIAEFPASPSKGGGSGRGRRGGGGGSRSRKTEKTADDIIIIGEEEIRDLERQIQLVGKSAEETARLRAQWEMLDAAKKAGLPVNAELNAKIEAQAAQVGQLTAELKRAELAQEQFDQAIDGIADAFAGALVAGESLRDGLAQVLKQIAADIINSGIRNALMSQFGGGGGFFSGLAQAFLGGGDKLTGALRMAGLPAISARAAGGPVRAGEPYLVGEKGPELIVPKLAGTVIPNHQLRRSSGTTVKAQFSPNISVSPGVTQADLAMTMQVARQEYERNFLPMLRKHLPEHNERFS